MQLFYNYVEDLNFEWRVLCNVLYALCHSLWVYTLCLIKDILSFIGLFGVPCGTLMFIGGGVYGGVLSVFIRMFVLLCIGEEGES